MPNPTVEVSLGDSITAGSDAAFRPWPFQLAIMRGMARTVVNHGHSGFRVGLTTDGKTSPTYGSHISLYAVWKYFIRTVYTSAGQRRLLILAGVNDIDDGTAASVIFDTLYGNANSIIKDALGLAAPNDWASVMISTVFPYGHYLAWNSTKQTQLAALNSSILGLVGVNPKLTVVDGYSLTNDPTTSTALCETDQAGNVDSVKKNFVTKDDGGGADYLHSNSLCARHFVRAPGGVYATAL